MGAETDGIKSERASRVQAARDWGTYRKLFENPPPAFERLPFAVRCLAAEVIRRCDRNGRIIPAEVGTSLAAVTDALLEDLIFHVRAHDGDREFIRAGVIALLGDGYLVVEDSYLKIRNFAEAQRSSTSAERMAKKRGRGRPSPETDEKRDTSDAGDACDGCDSGDAGPSHPESDRSRARSSRLVSSNSSSSGSGSDAHDGEVPCPSLAEWLAPEQRSSLETNSLIPGWAIDVMLSDLAATVVGSSKRMTLDQWRSYAGKALTRRWNNSTERPKKPAAKDDPAARARAIAAREAAAAAEAARHDALVAARVEVRAAAKAAGETISAPEVNRRAEALVSERSEAAE